MFGRSSAKASTDEFRRRTKLRIQKFGCRARMRADLFRYRSVVETPLFILAYARTGSQLLVSYLNSLAGVSMRKEVLNENKPEGIRSGPCSKEQVMKHLRLSVLSHSTQVGGVKLIFNQMRRHGVSVSDLENYFHGTKFLVLYRKSLGEQFVSSKIAQKNRKWSLGKGQSRKLETVLVEPSDFIKYCQSVRERYEEIRRDSFVMDNSLWIAYEELSESPEVLFKENVCPFLSVAYSSITTNFARQNPQPLSQKVANYSELEPLFSSGEARLDYDR